MNANSYYGLDDATDYGVAVFGAMAAEEVLSDADDIYRLICDWLDIPR